MISIAELRSFTNEGLKLICSMKGVSEAEIFASWNEQMIGRINYTSDIPCNGLQEPKSTEYLGVGVNVVFDTGGKRSLGFGYTSNEISINGLKEAFGKARQNRVFDPEFMNLPDPSSITKAPTQVDYHDANVMSMTEETFVKLGWAGLAEAVDTFYKNGYRDSLIIGGDMAILKERIAIRNSNGIDDFDETTVLTSNLTSMIECKDVKGAGWSAATHIANFRPEDAGMESAEGAIRAIGGDRIPSGRYSVIFGKQAIADILTNVLIPSLSLDTINTSNSPFLGRLGREIATKNLSIYDDGALPGEIGSRKITCEGIPTGRTYLIKDGTLVGFLSNSYYSNLFKNKITNFEPRNGFRFSNRGRDYSVHTKICPTNIVLEGNQTVSDTDALSIIGNGVYIGRIWYTYPVNGLAKGDFTSTIIGDSFIVEDGKLARPLRPNVVRINSNIESIIKNIIAIGNKKRSTIIWGDKEVVITPDIAVTDMVLENISGFMG